MNNDLEKKGFLRMRLTYVICLLLLVAVSVMYFQVKDYDFVIFDDEWYVQGNYHVRSGLTTENLKWSFKLQKAIATHWHPVTWVSHMLDCQLFGLAPAMHHMGNIFFHALTTVLLFLFLNKMTGAIWRSALVAALFALHPLNVNSVAWIAQRKNVLSAFFWMATMLAYFYYTTKPSIGRYLAAFFLFVIGLMSKPTTITLPFALLLLDFWPLGRFQRKENRGFWGPVLEKIPFFVLIVVFLFIYANAFSGDTMVTTDRAPMSLRVENALYSYVRYIELLIIPHGLAVYYPYPAAISFWKVLLSGGVIFSVSVFTVLKMTRAPYLFVGWFWYLGTLVPVLGISQVGLWPAMADRFVYIPAVGVFIAAVWGGHDLFSRLRYRTALLGTSAMVFLALLSMQTSKHLKTWKDSIALFENALNVTRGNVLIHSNFGLALERAGRKDEALAQYGNALMLDPSSALAHNKLGKLYADRGETDEAIKHFLLGLEREPDDAELLNNLGSVLAKAGRQADGVKYFLSAIKKDPQFAQAALNLCKTYVEAGDLDNADRYCERAVHMEPDNAGGYYHLGLIAAKKGLLDDAIKHYLTAVDLAPDMAIAQNNLGVSFARQNKLDKASAHFKKALDADPNFISANQNFCFTELKAGRLDAAHACYADMLRIDPDNRQARQNMQKVLEAKRLR